MTSFNFYDPEYQKNYNVIKYFSFSSSIFSLSSIFIVLFMYFRRKALRIFAFRLIIYLQISDGIMAFSMFLQIFDPITLPWLCQIQAFMSNFGCLSSFIWTCCICSSIYFSSTGKWRKIEEYEFYFLLICFGVPFLISIL